MKFVFQIYNEQKTGKRLPSGHRGILLACVTAFLMCTATAKASPRTFQALPKMGASKGFSSRSAWSSTMACAGFPSRSNAYA